jgi:hypothetical protein
LTKYDLSCFGSFRMQVSTHELYKLNLKTDLFLILCLILYEDIRMDKKNYIIFPCIFILNIPGNLNVLYHATACL